MQNSTTYCMNFITKTGQHISVSYNYLIFKLLRKDIDNLFIKFPLQFIFIYINTNDSKYTL